MFGNALGWGISAGIVAIAVWLLILLGHQAQISEPTAFGREAASYAVQLPTEPAGLAPYMAEPSEPGPLYHDAIARYEAQKFEMDQYDRITSTTSAEMERWKPVVALLNKAARSSRATVFAARPGDVINYDPENPKVEGLRTIGKAMLRFALLANREGDPSKAMEYGRAVFALGAKLYYERLAYVELDAGMELMGGAAAVLGQVEEGARAATLKEFDKARVEYYRRSILPVQREVMTLDPFTGDMVALAQNAGDAMWRVEAILALGRCKYSAERFGDQLGARRIVEGLCDSEDLRIRTAATAARDLTVERFRKLR